MLEILLIVVYTTISRISILLIHNQEKINRNLIDSRGESDRLVARQHPLGVPACAARLSDSQVPAVN